MKINYKQLPIKAHYFFFMAAMGPTLPFLPVYGKKLGVSAVVMGSITAILPILFLIAKPIFGFILDYLKSWRKTIFLILITTTSACFILMYFLLALPGPVLKDYSFSNVSYTLLPHCPPEDTSKANLHIGIRNTTCHWSCGNKNFTVPIQFNETDRKPNFSADAICLISTNATSDFTKSTECNVTCDSFEDNYSLYRSINFWGFVLLMSLGTIGFNVCNCTSDAICFDILGEGGQMGYGRQRVWGTIGFGIAAFLAGYAVDFWSKGEITKTYTPAVFLTLLFSLIDLFCCKQLELPIMAGSTNICKDVYQLLKLKPIIIFLCFATIAGIFDSFIIYFLFWYLEDLALATGHKDKITLIQGLIVAAETLGGEVIFFSFSGKILKKLGLGYTFTFCFICYALRLGLISLAVTPWWVIPIELLMQGPSYALCYTTIVAYASKVSPPGTSATVQGIVAGMDDGFGFAIGSLICGILYKTVGGVITLRIFSSMAATTAFVYLILYLLYLKETTPDTKKNMEWNTPEEAQKKCVVAE